MLKIDWKSRIGNKTFWVSMVSAVLLFVQAILTAFGVPFEITVLQADLTHIIETAFVILALLGIVVNPTTPGIGDNTDK